MCLRIGFFFFLFNVMAEKLHCKGNQTNVVPVPGKPKQTQQE
jgi:hypothetical protein